MPERRGFRFALEVLFLAGLAAALSFADLRPLVIAGLMLLGWLLVALLEWITWRAEAHYGRGLPPRYYLPRAPLPRPIPLEQMWHGYPEPEQREEAPTWVVSPAQRAELLTAWPLARPAAEAEPEPEEELVLDFDPIQLLAPLPEVSLELPDDDPVDREDALPHAAGVRLERHRIDPLRETSPSRLRWCRRADDQAGVATVPVRPEGLRLRPLPPRRED